MKGNKITFGLRSLHIAFHKDGVYETPIPMPGAVSFSPSPEGEMSPFFADDTRYFVTSANTGYSIDVEVALIPNEIKARMFGWEVDSNGMLVETADGIPEPFAILGEVQGDARARRFIYYDAQANRSSKTEQTKQESVEPNPDIIPMIASPITINDKMIVKGDIEPNETNKAVYDSFFESVYLPDFSVGA